MFTGIIENIGSVSRVQKNASGVRVDIVFSKPEYGLKLGESIAVDGVCLTVTQIGRNCFTADIVPETLKGTTFAFVRQGQPLHLERALKVGARLGGHTITGHVSGRGRVVKVQSVGLSKLIWIRVPRAARRLTQFKGSIAVNGVSLTIQEVRGDRIKIALVPHTLQETLLGKLRTADWVNIEAESTALTQKSTINLETASAIRRQVKQLTRQGF